MEELPGGLTAEQGGGVDGQAVDALRPCKKKNDQMIIKSNIKESKADRPRTRRRRPQLEIQEPQEEQLGGRNAHRPPGNRNDFLRIF